MVKFKISLDYVSKRVLPLQGFSEVKLKYFKFELSNAASVEEDLRLAIFAAFSYYFQYFRTSCTVCYGLKSADL